MNIVKKLIICTPLCKIQYINEPKMNNLQYSEKDSLIIRIERDSVEDSKEDVRRLQKLLFHCAIAIGIMCITMFAIYKIDSRK